MNMKRFILFLIVAFSITTNADGIKDVKNPTFDDFPAKIFTGNINIPEIFSKDTDGIWRDSTGKSIENPHINFSGKYFLSLHSCGTGCRYYLLTDLTTGEKVSSLEMFASTDPPPKTRDGDIYVTFLLFRANSSMLVAQYEIQKDNSHECRERIFIFNNEQVKPITKTRYNCTLWK